MTYTSHNTDQYRLELFDGKAYRVAAVGTRKELDAACETAPRPWRVTLAAKDRPAVPKYRKPNGSHTGSMTAREKVDAYLLWATRKGVDGITVFRNSGMALERVKFYAVKYGAQFNVRLVDVADFLGDAPQAEPDDGDEYLAAAA